jgi:hypothetical protein
MSDKSSYLMSDKSSYLMSDKSSYLMSDKSYHLMSDKSSYLMSDKSSFSGCKAAGAWNRPFASIQAQLKNVWTQPWLPHSPL